MAPGIIEKAKDKVIDAAEATKDGMQNVKDKVTGKQHERQEGQISSTGYDSATGRTTGVTAFQQNTAYDDPNFGVGGTGLHQPGTYAMHHDTSNEKGTFEKAKDKVLDTTKEGAHKIQEGAEKVKDKVMGSKHDKCPQKCSQQCTFDNTRVSGFDSNNQGSNAYSHETNKTTFAPNL